MIKQEYLFFKVGGHYKLWFLFTPTEMNIILAEKESSSVNRLKTGINQNNGSEPFRD